MPSGSQNAEVAAALAQIRRVYDARDPAELCRCYDRWAGDYDRQVSGVLGYSAARIGAETLARHVPTSAHVLDAAAGTGLAGRALHVLGFHQIWAVDISARMISKARAKGVYGRLVVADIEQALPLDPVFDAVIATGVFTAGHASPDALSRLLAVLAPQGVLCMSLRADGTAAGYWETLAQMEDRERVARLEVTPPFHCFPAIAEPKLMQIAVFRAGLRAETGPAR